LESFSEKVRRLVSSGKVRISEHGYDELSDDGLRAREVVAGLYDEPAVLVTAYRPDPKKWDRTYRMRLKS
jgi:hypothetical protein